MILVSNLCYAQIKVLNNPTTEIRGVIGVLENPSVKLNYKTENGFKSGKNIQTLSQNWEWFLRGDILGHQH